VRVPTQSNFIYVYQCMCIPRVANQSRFISKHEVCELVTE